LSQAQGFHYFISFFFFFERQRIELMGAL